MVGKDLTKITLPVDLNEPTSFLQKLLEFMEYEELLEKTHNEVDPGMRFAYIIAFNVA